jgi:bifunctional ADP-heptose synthase (sugar kinase/adenylyltransferase)
VVLFGELTADRLLEAIRPAVYAKGGDYSPEGLPEAATARASGARLALLPLVPDHSTSALITALRGSPRPR